LNNGGSPVYSSARNYFFGTTTRGPRQSQAWVVTSMFAEGRYAVEMDAAAVGNGCSPAPALSRVGPIGRRHHERVAQEIAHVVTNRIR